KCCIIPLPYLPQMLRYLSTFCHQAGFGYAYLAAWPEEALDVFDVKAAGSKKMVSVDADDRIEPVIRKWEVVGLTVYRHDPVRASGVRNSASVRRWIDPEVGCRDVYSVLFC